VGTSARVKDIMKGRKKVNMLKYFVFMYENRTMKSVEIILKRGRRD
jgi:hypothetical protein